MERLTRWIDDGEERQAIPEPTIRKNGHRKCCNKLAEYEDAEEQGLLLRLPCKIGDTVYRINKASKKISEHKVLKIETEMMETFFATKIWFENYDFTFAHRFGEVIFHTREEAEAKLKEMEGTDGK